VLYLVLTVDGTLLVGGSVQDPVGDPTTRDYLVLLYEVVVAAGCLWGVVFGFWGGTLAVLPVFRTADVHEVLPPLIAIVLVWEPALMDLSSGACPGVPAAARPAMVFGGPLSVTAVGLWELRRLRTRHGLTLRRALGR
jgi:hypothetical protein